MNLFRRKTIEQILAEASDPLLAEGHGSGLKRTLTVRDLTALGIAAIIGAGIFGTIGKASANGGPAVTLLFLFTAVACAFSALCYAEFASAIPISGSAYTYAYAAFGELMAWIIGWDLLMEYAIGNITVAISWSDYFTSFIQGFGLKIPEWLTMDFITARNAFSQIEQAGQLLVNHPALAVLDHFRQAPNAADLPQILTALKGLPASPEAVEAIKHFSISPKVVDAYNAWAHAPMLGSIRIIFDLPAFAIVSLITAIIYIGIQESKNLSNAMVAIKLIVIIFIIVMGFFYINPENWNPFAPEGFGGVMKGVSAVFFAYIGFDAISTTAEEAKDPRRDLPRAMIYSLVICTVLYVLLALTLTGMVHYKLLDVGDPLAFAFEQAGLPPSIKGIVVFLVSASAIVAMTSVLLVFQIGQPRIWLSMSRDGLLPPIFGRIHPKFRTPSFSTILTGITVSIPCMFMNLNEAADLTSIGTLFAFVLVCGGVLKMQMDGGNTNATFKVPYVNGKFILPALVLVFFGYVFLSAAGVVGSIVSATAVSDGQAVLNFLMLNAVPEQSAGEELYHGLPLFLFLIVTLAVSVLAFRNSLSLFPCLGLISCLYLMSFVDIQSWIRFLMWLFIGQIIYFLYGRQHSKLNNLPAA